MLNPVFRRELRTVLRTWKTYCAIAVYTLIIAAVGALFLYSLHYSYSSGFDPGDTMYLYIILSGFQLGLVLLITPALTSGSISGERERQTLDLMVITKMSALSIVIGKLLSSMMVILLLILASMPVFAIIFYYGGVSLLNLIGMTVFTVLVSATVGSIAMFLSSLLKRTIGATVLTYLIILALSLGSFVLAFFIYIFSDNYYYASYTGLSASASVLFNSGMFSVNPIMGFISVIDTQFGTDLCWELIYSMSGNYNYTARTFVPYWVFSVIAFAFITVMLLALTANVLNPVKKSRRFK